MKEPWYHPTNKNELLYIFLVFSLYILLNVGKNSLFHSAGFVSHTVKYVSHTVVFVFHSVKQRICRRIFHFMQVQNEEIPQKRQKIYKNRYEKHLPAKHFLTFGHYNTYTTFTLLYLLLHNHDFYS